jgi:hypothetical protein
MKRAATITKNNFAKRFFIKFPEDAVLIPLAGALNPTSLLNTRGG